MSNTGQAYEKAIQGIYSQILALDGLENITVEHNVTLKGQTSEHQIDVSWRFKLAGIEHQVVIQAKDWSSAVNQGAVLLFDRVISDLPGQPRGVMVARSGFQSGAVDVAKSRGIVLYELREPIDGDFEGRVKTIVFTLEGYHPDFRNLHPVIDDEWAKSQHPFSVQIGAPSDELFLRREDDSIIETLHIAMHRMLPKSMETFDWRAVSVEFGEPTYLDTATVEKPRIKLSGLRAEARVTKSSHKSQVTYQDLFQQIFKSLTGAETYFVNKTGNVERRQ